MSNTTFPSAIDQLFDPTPATTFDDHVNPHHLIEGRQNDSIEALEAKVGITGSNDTDSLDWKVTNILDGGVTIAPSPHASTHETGGLDPLPLDSLAAPTDNTNLNASTASHGLLPKLNGTATTYLDGSGHFSVPTATGGGGGTTYTGVNSVAVSGTTIALKNDSATPGNDSVYGTTSGGTLGWRSAAGLPVDWTALAGVPGTFAPSAHQASHITGTDPLPLASSTTRGLLTQLSGNTTDFVDGTNHCQSLAALLATLGITPTGGMIEFAGSAAPTGWLLCDGSSYLTASYPALFAVIGYSWGGTGANFSVPDLRGRTTLGAGQGTGLTSRALAAKGGEETHVLTIGELAQHNHTASQPDHYHTIPGAGNHTHSASVGDHQHGIPFSGNHTHSDSGHQHTYLMHPQGQTQAAGGGGAWAVGTGAANATAVGYASLTYSGNIGPQYTYWSSQTNNGGNGGNSSGIPPVTVNACGNINPNTTWESQTMGAVGAITVNNTGSNTGHNTMPPFVVVNRLIKT